MRPVAPSLAPILRSAAQGRLLAILLMDPGRSHGIRELATAADTSPMTAQREVDRAESAGLVVSRHEGRNRRVRGNPDHPLFQALRQVVVTAFGVPQVVAEEFAHIPGGDLVVLFGSWVARYLGEEGPQPADIDVLVVGDQVDREAVDAAADRAEQRLALPVQAMVRGARAWRAADEPDADDPFLVTVRARPSLTVLERDVAGG